MKPLPVCGECFYDRPGRGAELEVLIALCCWVHLHFGIGVFFLAEGGGSAMIIQPEHVYLERGNENGMAKVLLLHLAKGAKNYLAWEKLDNKQRIFAFTGASVWHENWSAHAGKPNWSDLGVRCMGTASSLQVVRPGSWLALTSVTAGPCGSALKGTIVEPSFWLVFL